MKSVVAVECFADRYFFGRLLQNFDIIRKCKNKNEVIKTFDSVKDSFLIGIIDEDRKDILLNPNLKNFSLIKDLGKTKIYKDNSKPHYIFTICPKAFEDWINEFIIMKGKNLLDFDYENFEDFLKSTKSESIDKDDKFKILVKYILDNYLNFDNHISKIKIHIDYLLQNKYNVNMNDFKNL